MYRGSSCRFAGAWKLDSQARAPTGNLGFGASRRGAKVDPDATMRRASGPGVYIADRSDMRIGALTDRFERTQRAFLSDAPEWALWLREHFAGLATFFLAAHQATTWVVVAARRRGLVDLKAWEEAINDRWLLDDYVNFTNHPSRDLWFYGDEAAAKLGRITVKLPQCWISEWRDAMPAAALLVVAASPALVAAYPYAWGLFGRRYISAAFEAKLRERHRLWRERPRATDKNSKFLFG